MEGFETLQKDEGQQRDDACRIRPACLGTA